MPNPPTLLHAWLLVAGALLASEVLARQDAPPPAPPPASPASPLSGPAVEDRQTPGAPSRFGDTMKPDKMHRGERVPVPVFRAALESLDRQDTLRLSADQSARIKAVMEEFQASGRAFRAENKDQLKRLRELAGPKGGQAPRGPKPDPAAPPPPTPPGADEPATPEQRAARLQLRELMQKAPRPEDAYARIWPILTSAQQAHVRAAIETAQAEDMRTRAEPRVREEVRRRLEKRRPTDPKTPPEPQTPPKSADAQGLESDDGKTPGAAQLPPGFEGLSRQQIRAKLRELPPEERRRIAALLRERAAQRQKDGPARQTADKPAPSMDDVKVPQID